MNKIEFALVPLSGIRKNPATTGSEYSLINKILDLFISILLFGNFVSLDENFFTNLSLTTKQIEIATVIAFIMLPFRFIDIIKRFIRKNSQKLGIFIFCFYIFHLFSMAKGQSLQNHENLEEHMIQKRNLQLVTDYGNQVGSLDLYGAKSVILSNDASTAFVTTSTDGFIIVDVKNPESPSIQSVYQMAAGKGLLLSDDEKYAYVTDQDSLLIFAISDIKNPVLVSKTHILGRCQTIRKNSNGTILYFSCLEKGFCAVNVTNKNFPRVLFTSSTGLTYNHIEPLPGDHYAISALGNFIQLIDVQDASNIKFSSVKISQTNAVYISISINGSLAYISNYFTGGNGISIYDISQVYSFPNSSLSYVFLKFYASNSPTFTYLARDQSTLYIADDEELLILNVTNSSSPVPIGICSSNYYIKQIAVNADQNYIYTAEDFGGFKVRVKNFKTLTNVYGDMTNILMNSLGVSGLYAEDQVVSVKLSKLYNRVYIARKISGLATIHTIRLQTVQSSPLPEMRDIVLTSDEKYLFAACGNKGLYMLNMTNQFSITQHLLTRSVSSVDYVFLAPNEKFLVYLESNDFFKILDISNLSNPTTIYQDSTIESSVFISSDSKYMFTSENTDIGLVYDISNPANPIRISRTLRMGHIKALSSDGKIGYSCHSLGMSVINLTNLAAPTIIVSEPSPACSDIKIKKDYSTVFMADSKVGIKMFDNSDITRLYQIDAWPFGSMELAISKDDFVLWSASPENGLQKLDLTNKYALEIPEIHQIGVAKVSTINAMYNPFNDNRFTPYNKPYKFAHISFYSFDYQNTYQFPALKDWIYYDPNYGSLTTYPTSYKLIGDYILYGRLSNKISNDIFVSCCSLDANSSLNLLNNLIGNGYVDIQYYLTELFDYSYALDVPNAYLSIEPKIRAALTSYLVETFTRIKVVPSLTLSFGSSDDRGLDLETESTSIITCTIILYNGSRFISNNYPATTRISENKSLILITGLITDIKTTLQQLLIAVEGDSADGYIEIDDTMNPVYSNYITNISSYLEIYREPLLQYNLFKENYIKIPIETTLITVPFDLFIDENKNPADLVYIIHQLIDGEISSLPLFVSFDPIKNVITLNPDKNDTNYNEDLQQYRASIILRIQTENTGGLTSVYDFTVIIQNDPPQLLHPVQLQIAKYSFISRASFNIRLATDTFIDPQNAELIYTLSMAEGYVLPSWIDLSLLIRVWHYSAFGFFFLLLTNKF